MEFLQLQRLRYGTQIEGIVEPYQIQTEDIQLVQTIEPGF